MLRDTTIPTHEGTEADTHESYVVYIYFHLSDCPVHLYMSNICTAKQNKNKVL